MKHHHQAPSQTSKQQRKQELRSINNRLSFNTLLASVAKQMKVVKQTIRKEQQNNAGITGVTSKFR